MELTTAVSFSYGAMRLELFAGYPVLSTQVVCGSEPSLFRPVCSYRPLVFNTHFDLESHGVWGLIARRLEMISEGVKEIFQIPQFSTSIGHPYLSAVAAYGGN